MTDQAYILLWISSGLICSIFIAIVGTSLYGYFSQLVYQKIDKTLDSLLSPYFQADEDRHQQYIDRINQYTKRSRIKMKMLISIIIRYGEEFIDNHHELILQLCEKTEIKVFLIKGLSAKRDYNKALACRQLGDLKLYSTEANICKLMNSKNNNVVYNVLLALAKLGDLNNLADCLISNSREINISFRAIMEIVDEFKGSKVELIAKTIDDCDDYLRSILIKAVADGQYEALSSYYIKYLSSNNTNLKIACLRALCELGNQSYEHYVTEKLNDVEWEVRAAAAKGLEKIGTSHSFESLVTSTSDSEWWVRHNAAHTLVFIPGGKNYAQKIIEGEDQYARDSILAVWK